MPVAVGNNANIGANAVVIKDVLPFAVMVGIPAKNININNIRDKKFRPYGVKTN